MHISTPTNHIPIFSNKNDIKLFLNQFLYRKLAPLWHSSTFVELKRIKTLGGRAIYIEIRKLPWNFGREMIYRKFQQWASICCYYIVLPASVLIFRSFRRKGNKCRSPRRKLPRMKISMLIIILTGRKTDTVPLCFEIVALNLIRLLKPIKFIRILWLKLRRRHFIFYCREIFYGCCKIIYYVSEILIEIH